jgi:hypothetical protein
MPDKKPMTSMSIEPMPTKPRTFTDRNLERGYGEGGANNVSTSNAKPGGSISPIQRTSSIKRTKPMGRA